MLHLLKKLLPAGACRREARRRRARRYHLVGRLEKLETRTVLSASYGGALADPRPVEIATAVWENGRTGP
jgi:hypothetical protein